MDNPYDGYIATNRFEVKADYDDQPPTMIQEGEYLLFSRKLDETWEFVHNDKYIEVSLEIVKKSLKIHSDLYQEQFSHLDKNHLYFCQLTRGDQFIIEKNSVKEVYYKIGEYTTKEGIKYNSVKNQEYFEADNADEFDINNMAFFKEDYLIKKDYKFRISPGEEHLDGTYNFMKEKAFKFIEPIKVCDYIVNHPKMLDVIECLFQGRKLTLELKSVYTEYKEDMQNRENQMCGFFESEEIPLPELRNRIKEKSYKKSYRTW